MEVENELPGIWKDRSECNRLGDTDECCHVDQRSSPDP